MDVRKSRGKEIANLYNLSEKKGAWLVPSMSGNRTYRVIVNEIIHFCTCLDFETTGKKCKHIYAVEYSIQHKRHPGRPPNKKPKTLRIEKRKTYPQNWIAYNAAQTYEKQHFQKLLFNLCKGVDDFEPGRGRPRMPLSDALFSSTFKVYSTISGRRFMTDLREAKERGYISKVPHFNSIFNYLENPALSQILTAMIEYSSSPLRAIEIDFASDSTGFSSSRFGRWFDYKYNAVKKEHDWIKCHAMCGVKTNIITSVEIHGKNSHDAPIFPQLMEVTAENFQIREVSADKGYGSLANMNVVTKVGGTPFFAFKSNATGGKGAIWEKMYHYFSLKREDYLNHYHKRSNIESTFHMIKSKFRGDVRSKTYVSMKNEVLCKVLSHNICCLISAMYELGIDPEFGGEVEGFRKVA